MKTLENGPWAREADASAKAGAAVGGATAREALNGKRSDASSSLDASGRFLHPCCHPECSREGAFGVGADLRRYLRAAEKGEVDAGRWLGRWWCRAHVPEGFLPVAGASTLAASAGPRKPEEVRRQVKNGQGVLL